MIENALAWLTTHPALLSLGVALGGAIFNWVCKPRTAAEYAAMSPSRAGFFRFMAATFPDPEKAWNSLILIVRKERPENAPTVITTVTRPADPEGTVVRALTSDDGDRK